MPKIFDLRQDRKFIKSNFDGYKLSLDNIPIFRKDLVNSPLNARPSDEQYSFLHAELMSLQNLLVSDPWDRASSYFINTLGQIIKCSYDNNIGQPDTTQIVYVLPNIGSRKSGDYGITFQFISEEYCVICNGINDIFLINTGGRCKSTEWKDIFNGQISEEYTNFVLKDCRLDLIDDRKVISLALQRVHYDSTVHLTQLFWCILRQDLKTNKWLFEIKDIIQGKASLYFTAFEPTGCTLIIASNKELKFLSNLEEQVITETASESGVKNGDISEKEVPVFSWAQTEDDVVLNFNAIENTTKSDYNIKTTKSRLTVNHTDNCLFDFELFDQIDPDLTTWTLENNFLQVNLVKVISSVFWPIIYEGGPRESNEGCNNTSPNENQPIPNLEAPIEDCDFPIGSLENDITIDRFNLHTKEVTHRVLLGNTPPLFSTSLYPEFPNAFATRSDVDACLWLPQFNAKDPVSDWDVKHEGNIHAFGYIQASKQQKKFMNCSPDLNYAVICESLRHVFIYKSNYDSAGNLRNRNGNQITVGKQHMITLEDAGEVLGLTTDNNIFTILTEKAVLYVQLN